MQYAVDSQRQRMIATGIVDQAMAWEETPDGKRRPSKTVQERDENTGMPQWDVEVTYRSVAWGRESTATAKVRVGQAERPTLQEFTPVTFKFLAVEVRVNSKSGGFSEHWSAEALDTFSALKSPAPKSAA